MYGFCSYCECYTIIRKAFTGLICRSCHLEDDDGLDRD